MKKIILSLAILASISFIATAQEVKKPADAAAAAPVAPNPNAAEIKFETDVHDYGSIKKGADGSCEFKFKNVGKEPLIISNAQGSCGCTVPTWPKEPIKPGESSVIKVHYDTNRVGTISKSVTITSNAKTSTMVLRIKGTVEAAPVEEQFPTKKSDNGGIPFEKAGN